MRRDGRDRFDSNGGNGEGCDGGGELAKPSPTGVQCGVLFLVQFHQLRRELSRGHMMIYVPGHVIAYHLHPRPASVTPSQSPVLG